MQEALGKAVFQSLKARLVETMMEPREGACLTVTQAYDLFCRMTQQRNLDQLKRSQFKELMRDLIREKYGVALRNDVPDNENKQQQAWKGLAVVDTETLAA